MKLLGKMHQYKTMLSYCLKCNKNAENINPSVSKTSNKKTSDGRASDKVLSDKAFNIAKNPK